MSSQNISMNGPMRQDAETTLKTGPAQNRKKRGLDRATSDQPKARRRLDDSNPATGEDYLTVELIKKVIRSAPALSPLGIRRVHAFSYLNRDIRQSISDTCPGYRRWKFVLKAIELIEKYPDEIPWQGNLFRKLARVDLEFALVTAEKILKPIPKLNVLKYIVEGLLEEAIEIAQTDPYCPQQDPLTGQRLYESGKHLFETKQILQKATKIAYTLERYADATLSKIAFAYFKAGLLEEALELTEKITCPCWRSSSLANIAAATTDPKARGEIFKKALTVAKNDHELSLDLPSKISSLTYIGAKLAETSPTAAKEMLQGTFDIANAQQHPVSRSNLLSRMTEELVECAGELAARELLDEVVRMIEAIPNAEGKSRSYAMLTEALVKAGLLDKAIQFIGKIDDPDDPETKAKVLLLITEKFLDMDHKTKAQEYFQKAETLWPTIEYPPEDLSLRFEQMQKRIHPTELPRNTAVVLARTGRHQKAYEEAMKMTDVSDKIATLSEIARERTKENPEAGLAIFNEAIIVYTLEHQEEKRKALWDIDLHMATAGFPNVSVVFYTGDLAAQLVDKAAMLAKIDLSAAEEIFQDVIKIRSGSPKRFADPTFGLVQKLAEVGLSQKKEPEKTPETYAHVSAHYVMEIYKAKLENNSPRLAELALRQAAYDPEIGSATCGNISDIQIKTNTLTRITAMRVASRSKLESHLPSPPLV